MFSENLENQNILAESGVRDLGVEKVSGEKKKKKTQDELPKQKKVNSMAFLS